MESLEREFAYYLANHKYRFVLAKAVQYYKDLEENNPKIPDFQRKGFTPEDLAMRDVNALIANDFKAFNKVYEQAYQDLAEVLP